MADMAYASAPGGTPRRDRELTRPIATALPRPPRVGDMASRSWPVRRRHRALPITGNIWVC